MRKYTPYFIAILSIVAIFVIVNKNSNISKDRERLYRESVAVAKVFEKKPMLVIGDYGSLLKSIHSN